MMSRQLQPRKPISDPDADLVWGLKCGTPESFDLLEERYKIPVFSYIARLIDDPQEAEDLVQDVFVKVFRKIQGFREESKFKTWLYRIATREASNRRRWYSRHRWREVALSLARGEGGCIEDCLAHPGRSPFDETERLEQREILDAALARINPQFREAVVLRDINGFTYREIADTLGISLGTVKSRILRGRAALRRHLRQHAPAIVPHGTWQTE